MSQRIKYPVTRYRGSRIRHLGAKGPYQSDFTAHGKQVRKRHKTLAEAKTFIDQKIIEAKNTGMGAFAIRDRDRIDLAAARKWCDVPLGEVFDFWKAHHVAVEAMPVDRLVKAFLEAPGRRGGWAVTRRDRTIDNHRKRLMPFVGAFAGRQINEITGDDVETWLDVGGWQGLNRRNYLASVRALFRYAVKHGYAAADSTAKIELPAIHATEPIIMPVETVSRYLHAVEALHPELLPREAMAFFTGLRTAELSRLEWRNVSIENRLITVGGDVAKIAGHRRNVEIPNNLMAWLSPYLSDAGPIIPSKALNRVHSWRREAAERVKFRLPHNAARHAYASYHVAATQNAPLTAEALGHDDVRLLRTVYRNITSAEGKPITQAEGKAYFDIRPKREKGVIRFRKAI